MKKLKTSQVGAMVSLSRQQVRALALQGKIPGAQLVGKQLHFDSIDAGFKEWVKTRLYFQETNKKRPDEWYNLISGFNACIARRAIETQWDAELVGIEVLRAVKTTLRAIHEISPKEALAFKRQLIQKLDEEVNGFKKLAVSRFLGRGTGSRARRNGGII